jgi:acid phosphatase family membrane protein YuiD
MSDYIYIIAPICGWLVAQGIKFFLSLRKDGISWNDFVQSGGMPSSHTAFMVALLTVIGVNNGIQSAIFGVTAAVTAIIIYDAMGVRRTTGEQTVAIKELSDNQKYKLKIKINNSKGHTPAQIVVGIIVGALVGGVLVTIL